MADDHTTLIFPNQKDNTVTSVKLESNSNTAITLRNSLQNNINPFRRIYGRMPLEENVEQVKEKLLFWDCCDNKCFHGLDPVQVLEHRTNIFKMSLGEQDAYFMGQLMAFIEDNPNQLRMKYNYRGRQVCQRAYLYLHYCTFNYILNLKNQILLKGAAPKQEIIVKKNKCGRLTSQVFEEASNLLREILEISVQDEIDLLLNNKIIRLNKSRAMLHEIYKNRMRNIDPDKRVMGYKSFLAFLRLHYPFIQFKTMSMLDYERQDYVKKEIEKLSQVILEELQNIQGVKTDVHAHQNESENDKNDFCLVNNSVDCENDVSLVNNFIVETNNVSLLNNSVDNKNDVAVYNVEDHNNNLHYMIDFVDLTSSVVTLVENEDNFNQTE